MSQLPLGNLNPEPRRAGEVPGIGLAAVAAWAWPIITILTLRNDRVLSCPVGIPTSSVRMRMIRCRASRSK